MINYFLFTLCCFAASFSSTSASRAKNSSAVLVGFLFGLAGDLFWFILFKDLISENVFEIKGILFYILYLAGYSGGRTFAQYLFIKFERGKASVGGTKLLEDRIAYLEKEIARIGGSLEKTE